MGGINQIFLLAILFGGFLIWGAIEKHKNDKANEAFDWFHERTFREYLDTKHWTREAYLRGEIIHPDTPAGKVTHFGLSFGYTVSEIKPDTCTIGGMTEMINLIKGQGGIPDRAMNGKEIWMEKPNYGLNWDLLREQAKTAAIAKAITEAMF